MKRVSKERCLVCGGAETRTRENFRMPLVGNWGVTIEDAEVLRCTGCGERGISIQKLGPLMRSVAAAVARKRGRLAPEEVTFLRKHLDYTGAKLAKVLGVTAPTVSRWEHGEAIGASADRLLRAVVLLVDHGEETFDPAQFEAIEDGDATAPTRLSVRQDARGSWRAAAA